MDPGDDSTASKSNNALPVLTSARNNSYAGRNSKFVTDVMNVNSRTSLNLNPVFSPPNITAFKLLESGHEGSLVHAKNQKINT